MPSRAYIFALLLFLSLIFMVLYQFYFNAIKMRSNNGISETNSFKDLLCQIFTTYPRSDREDLHQLKSKIEDINKSQIIRNFKGVNVTEQSIFIVVQVHKRANYLNKLIKSLKSVKNINSTILIFSHDYFSEELNDLVNSIDFSPVLQIFFPFSIQLYPNWTSPKDCKSDLDVEEAKAQGCTGVSTPDESGHFRRGEITQLKHHWWWKINTVFDQLHVTKNFNGYVMFLEEDHYLAPDALHVLRLMIELANVKCPECNSFHIGNSKNTHSYEETAHKVDVSQFNNLGFSFNRTMWKALKECSNVFCTYNDYNWDWTFEYTAQKCFDQKLTALVVRASRVFHIGECGVHHNSLGCSSNKLLEEVEANLDAAKPYLYPNTLELENMNSHNKIIEKNWGGWADLRDIQLCLKFSNS